MGILFEDKIEAQEYQKMMRDDGITTKLVKAHYGQERKQYYEVIRIGSTEEGKRAKRMTKEFNIPPEHIITYYENPTKFALQTNPKVRIHKEKVPTHILFAHELAHQQLDHVNKFADNEESYTKEEKIQREKEAWQIAINNLKKAGEWDEEAKKIAVLALASYYEGNTERGETEQLSEDSIREAANFIDSYE